MYSTNPPLRYWMDAWCRYREMQLRLPADPWSRGGKLLRARSRSLAEPEYLRLIVDNTRPGMVQKKPFLGYRCRAETAGPSWLDFASKAVL
jgi:hypothetical protein